MAAIVSLGSLNVDCVQYCQRDAIRALEDRYNWFPGAGETVRIDRVPDEFENRQYLHFLGGKGANQAVAAAQCAGSASLLGCVGADETEYDVLATLAHQGVSVDGIDICDRETGKAYIFVDDTGEAWIAILGGANDTTDEQYIARHYDQIRAADALILQNEIPLPGMHTLLAQLSNESVQPTVVFNPAPPTRAGAVLEHEAIDVLVVNETEYAALEPVIDHFNGTVIRTNGSNDIVVSGAEHCRVSPPVVDPVDTTGSGDVFCGYLAARLAEGDAIERATELAAVAASLSTETEGAQEGIPTLEEVNQFVTSTPEIQPIK